MLRVHSALFIAASILGLLSSSAAISAPVTYIFSGTSIYNAGLTANGSITIDPNLLPSSTGDGLTNSALVLGCGAATAGFMAQITRSDGVTFSYSDQYFNCASQGVFRNYSGNFNAAYISGRSYNDHFGTGQSIVLMTEDYLGAGTSIFLPSSGGSLDPRQKVNWLSPNARNFVNFSYDSNGAIFNDEFTLTSLLSSNGGRMPIPEPATISLTLVALLGVLAARGSMKVR